MKRQIFACFCYTLVTVVICGVHTGCSSRPSEPGAAPSQSSPGAQNVTPGSAATPQPAGSVPSAASQPAAAPTTETAARPAAVPARAGSSASTPSQPAAAPAAKTEAAPAPKPEAAPAPPRTFTLERGHSISVETSSTLSTKSNKSGDTFEASLVEPIVDGDWVIAKKGATVEGMIVESDPGGRVEGVASMRVALKRLTLADGRTIELSTGSFTTQAKSTKKNDAAKVGIGAGVGAAVGAIAGGGKGAAIGTVVGGGAGAAQAMATRGDPATIPGETRLTFKLTAPVEITKQ